MITCRSIPPSDWEHARQALIFYFSRRAGFSNAEDLAHDTLAAFWRRADYEFADSSDFLRVCHGFAGRILKASLREAHKTTTVELLDQFSAPDGRIMGLTGVELLVMLDEVLIAAKKGLSPSEWLAVEKRVYKAMGEQDDDEEGDDQRTKTKDRVRLFRARTKLAGLTDWRKKRM